MRRIDELDMITIDGVRCCRGHILPYGATITDGGGINFSISSADATRCELRLFHAGEAEPYATIRIPPQFRTGDCYSIIVFDQDPEELEYTYRFDGPNDRSKGYRFDPSIDLLDPYAKLITGRDVWAEDASEIKPLRSKVIFEDYNWEGDAQLETPFEDLVIYEMHVRGFTKDPSSAAKHKGTYLGIVEMIPYLKELGVNAHWEKHTLRLPSLPEGHRWTKYVYSFEADHSEHPVVEYSIELAPRSLMVLVSEKEERR